MKKLFENIQTDFNITPQLLEERTRVGIYIDSFASLIIERYFEKLLRHPLYRSSLNSQFTSALKQVYTQFFTALFHDSFEPALLHKLKMRYFQFPLANDMGSVLATFSLFQECVIEVGSVNEVIAKDTSTILKFLQIAQYIMAKSIDKQKNTQERQNDLVSVLESLYKAHELHKQKNQILQNSFSKGSLKQEIKEGKYSVLPSASVCPFTTLTKSLEDKAKDFLDLQQDLKTIKKLHEQYHQDAKSLYKSIENGAIQAEQTENFNTLQEQSKELFEALNKPFEKSSSVIFLTISSGMRFTQKYTQLLHNTHDIPIKSQQKLQRYLQELAYASIKDSLAWVVEDIAITDEPKRSDLYEEIVIHNSSFYICISLKNVPYKHFIIDLLRVFLQLLKNAITTREKEQYLIELAQKAESANQSKDTFLASMSHELRTPLNAIIGFSQILKTRSEIPENLRAYIEKIGIAGNNLLNLVNTILDFAKIEAGKISFHPRTMMIAPILSEVQTLISPMAQEKDLTLHFPGEISLALFADEQLLKQVIINLLSNAVKFTPNGGSVTLSLKFEEKQIKMSISDTGIGIPKNAIGKLFTPFEQAHSNTDTKTKGTGLGLAISKKIIEELHGGSIWVESNEGEGSTFYITLPLSSELSILEKFISEKEEAAQLLIVEDSKEYSDFLVEKLRKNFHITLTNSISKAKELLDAYNYDNIILDFFLIDGMSSDIIDYLQVNTIQTPVYIISAEDDVKLVGHFKDAENIVGIFNKSDVEIICETINRVANE